MLALLDEIGSPATVASAAPRYFGFVTGGALPATVASRIEEIALGWLLDVLGLPSTCGGAFVTGATIANFAGLAAARHAVLASAGWDVEAQGLFGAPPIAVVVRATRHTSPS